MPRETNGTSAGAESNVNPDELLVAGALALGIRLDVKDIAAFRFYRTELLRWSGLMNLTALTTPAQIVQQGFLDSLACAALLPIGEARVLDVGSGAGFPALPLALARPALDFTLVEPSRKKISFLRHVVRQLNLSRVRIRVGRIQSFFDQRAMVEAFDVALARAVAPLHEVGRLVRPFLRPSGVFLAQVGPAAGVRGGMDPLLRCGFEITGETAVPATFGKTARRILALRKTGTR